MFVMGKLITHLRTRQVDLNREHFVSMRINQLGKVI